MTLEQILEDFEALEPGEERYRYLIDLGKDLPGLPDELKVEENRILGCLSRVWLVADPVEDGVRRLHLRADSDAFIVRGLIAIVLAMYQDRTAAEILAVDTNAIFASIGLDQHLSMGRRNGLHSMVQRVRAMAAAG